MNQVDNQGRGPLHHATILGHTGLACLFLKRGADLGVRDSEGRDPLTIAVETANADIVTLLRLAKMREADAAQGQAGKVHLPSALCNIVTVGFWPLVTCPQLPVLSFIS